MTPPTSFSWRFRAEKRCCFPVFASGRIVHLCVHAGGDGDRVCKREREGENGEGVEEHVSSNMLGGASQIVSMIRVKCNGT